MVSVQGNNLNIIGNQLFGMFGGSSKTGNLGGLTGMGYNCYGEINYDAVLGYQLFNVAKESAFFIVQNSKENQEPKVNYTQKLSETKSEINTKREQVADLERENTTLNTEITSINKNITDLKAEKTTAETDLKTAENELSKLNASDTGYAVAKSKYDDAKAKVKEIETKIEKAEQEKKDTETKISENEQKIDKLEQEIKKLETQKLEYEQAKAQDGGEDCLKTGFYDKETNPASKKALKTGISKFKKALDSGDEGEIRKYATIVKEMYTSNPTELSKYKELYDKANTWLTEHPEEES